MTYTDLIAKLEAATEGSRELDEAIARFVGELPPNAVFSIQNPEDGSEHYQWDTGERDEYGPLLDGTILKQRTRSLDAALTLMRGLPRKDGLCCIFWIEREPTSENTAELWLAECRHHDDRGQWTVSAPTAALAACKAILRARQSLEERK